MNLTICLSAAFLILSHAAFCMPIRGQVKAGNKGLSHVVITDGINFTQTDTKGNFLLDTDQEARFAAKGHARENRHGNDRLELRQHEERGAPRHIQRNEHGNQNQLPRLRLSALENQEERQHTFEQNEQRNEIVPFPAETVHADEQRQRNEQKDQNRRKDRAFSQLSLFNGRLDEIIRPVRLAANGQCKHEQREKQNAVELELAARKRCQSTRVHQLC